MGGTQARMLYVGRLHHGNETKSDPQSAAGAELAKLQVWQRVRGLEVRPAFAAASPRGST